MRYFTKIRRRAAELKADGCSYVPEFYHIACLRHDIHYRTHCTLQGAPITKARADKLFESGMRHLSAFKQWSPMAWWRYVAVKYFANKAWEAGLATENQ